MLHTEEVAFVVSVGTADYCGQVIANVDVHGSLSVYGDIDHTIEKHVWNKQLRVPAYFKATFTSSTVSLFFVRLDTVTATVRSTWVNTVTLYTLGAATTLGTTVGFNVPAPYLTDVYFDFDVARLFNELAAPVNATMTITATVTTSFSSGLGRKRSLESAYLISSEHSKRLGSNTRTLRSDTNVYLGAAEQEQEQQPQYYYQQQQQLPDQHSSINTNPLGMNREGPQLLLVPNAVLVQGMYLLGAVVALLVIVLLVLLIVKQVKNLL